LCEKARGIRNLVVHLGEDYELVRCLSFASHTLNGISDLTFLLFSRRQKKARLTAALHPLSQLRALHILSQRSDVSPTDVLSLVEQCVLPYSSFLPSLPYSLLLLGAPQPSAKSDSVTASGSSNVPIPLPPPEPEKEEQRKKKKKKGRSPRLVSDLTIYHGGLKRYWLCGRDLRRSAVERRAEVGRVRRPRPPSFTLSPQPPSPVSFSVLTLPPLPPFQPLASMLSTADPPPRNRRCIWRFSAEPVWR
jgi:hypothetical protein